MANKKPVPVLSSRTYALGPQSWRVDQDGNWETMAWGWWPNSNGRPSHRWIPVPLKEVPQQLRSIHA